MGALDFYAAVASLLIETTKGVADIAVDHIDRGRGALRLRDPRECANAIRQWFAVSSEDDLDEIALLAVPHVEAGVSEADAINRGKVYVYAARFDGTAFGAEQREAIASIRSRLLRDPAWRRLYYALCERVRELG